MTKEQIYTQQLQALGTYDPAFDPEIKQLAQLERELTRAKKQWSRTVPTGEAPSVLDPHYPVIRQLRQDILAHREALGLTPKSLARLRGKNGGSGETATAAVGKALDRLWEAVSDYD